MNKFIEKITTLKKLLSEHLDDKFPKSDSIEYYDDFDLNAIERYNDIFSDLVLTDANIVGLVDAVLGKNSIPTDKFDHYRMAISAASHLSEDHRRYCDRLLAMLLLMSDLQMGCTSNKFHR